VRKRQKASAKLKKDIERLRKAQDLLYAQKTHASLIVLQAMDTAKDGTIQYVTCGVNPPRTQFRSFGAPPAEGLARDFLWRATE
jgi:polyphosphate kinase 2 (PPK2 family)